MATTTKAVAERDASCKAYLKMWMDSLTGTVTSATETALREWCMKAEAKVDEL